jgi:type II secretory ATPase GspE/PulE/Tfp pilus assembly ATPase PilB-like protein
MTAVTELETKEMAKASQFCKAQWGWQSPPKAIRDRAINTIRFSDNNFRVGEIISYLKLMPASKVERLAAQRQASGVQTPLIDYIIENETDTKDFPEHKSSILAYRYSLQYFEDLNISGLYLHPDMDDTEVRDAAKKFKAALFLIESETPVLVFSSISDEYQQYMSEGKAEQLRNPFKTRYPDLKVAAANSVQVMAAIDGDTQARAGESQGREIWHNELRRSGLSSHEKLANIHHFVSRYNGTDIHIEPVATLSEVPVFGRFDTILRKLDKTFWFTAEEYQQIKQYLTSLSGAVQNNAVLQRPADGRYTYRFSDQSVDVRCSFIPTGQDTTFSNNNIYIRLRLLRQAVGAIELQQYGLSPVAIKHMIRAIRAESGMSLMVGPTGSGKSTSLFGMVNEHYKIFKDSKSRISIEDPVERKVPNVTQIQISEQIKSEGGNPFLAYLKFLLRFDPDFMVIGEMRDAETVEAGGNYANTGHIVLGTLHANDTITAIERIVNLLKDDDLRRMIISTMHYIFSQRLVPILCEHCKITKDIEQDLYEDIVAHVQRSGNNADTIPTHGCFQSEAGCAKCDHTGVMGKQPISEVLEITDEVKRIVFSSDPEKLIKLRTHREITLFDEAMKLILSKKASVKELFKC